MQTQSTILIVLVSLALIGAILAAELSDVFQSNSQSSSTSQSQPESTPELLPAGFAKWKRGINLGRKMMCQIDHRNCGSFNEAKRFNQQPKINYNVLAYLLKNNLQNTESLAPLAEDK
ncbi:hypothetical protein TYRP_016697 [Tyrophagus putrescentiae]|nr:hypothetical protein TYRP_016697 [Tyrophagus putrescentiae]